MPKFEADAPEKITIIADAGVDLDDEQALVLGSFLQREGYMELQSVTANLKPAVERARLVRGTLDMLGYGLDLPDIPVGIGMSNIEKVHGEPTATEETCPYLSDISRLKSGDEVLTETLMNADPKGITLVLESGLADAAALALTHGDLFKDRVKRVVVMGGVKREESKAILDDGLMVPDTANNNTFNKAGSDFLYRWLQEEEIPLTVTTRDAAYAAQVPFKIFEDLQDTGNPIGPCLANRQFPSIRLLWKRANAPEGSEDRGPLPADRDRAWFVNVFCEGKDPLDVSAEEDIVPHMGKANLYDPINLIAAIPALKDRFFSPTVIGANEVIGISGQQTNVKPGSDLAEFMHDAIVRGCQLGAVALSQQSSNTLKN
jgi:hypothetical protein